MEGDNIMPHYQSPQMTTEEFEIKLFRLYGLSLPEKSFADIAINETYHHHNYMELIFIIKGSMLIYTNNTLYKAESGDCIVINNFSKHCIPLNSNNADYIIICFEPLSIRKRFSLIDNLYITPFVYNHKTWFIQKNSLVHSIYEHIDKLLLHMSVPNFGYELLVYGDILQLFSYLLPSIKEVDGTLLFNKTSFVSSSEKEVHNILMLPPQEVVFLSGAEAAKQCGLSYTHFNRLFQKVTNLTFHQYIVLTRLSLAKDMLIATDKSIEEIARDANYSSASFFISQYKYLLNITPSKYRKEMRKKLTQRTEMDK